MKSWRVFGSKIIFLFGLRKKDFGFVVQKPKGPSRREDVFNVSILRSATKLSKYC
jgi:hypothetical protein